MTRSELEALAARVEVAEGPDDQIDVLRHAFYVIFPAPEIGTEERGRWVDLSRSYHRMLDAEAYESAALMLISPDDTFWRVGHDGKGADPSLFLATVFTPVVGRANRPHDAVAATPALAICAAALKALAQGADHA